MDQIDYNRFVKDRWRIDPAATVPAEIVVMALGMTGEAGEVADAIKKLVRGDGTKEKLIEELGDLMFYVTRIAAKYGISFDRIRESNVNKLLARDVQRAAKGDTSEGKTAPAKQDRAGSRRNFDH